MNPVTGESQVLHIKTFNQSDPFRGLPPIKAAADAVDTHRSMSTSSGLSDALSFVDRSVERRASISDVAEDKAERSG